ncbi:hypothetical protein B0H19DRAFT_1110374 [Mycena capillaripes]|nr:hypothetical protein B0H19DRAFT_1110374 [Mycena capillaripes]
MSVLFSVVLFSGSYKLRTATSPSSGFFLFQQKTSQKNGGGGHDGDDSVFPIRFSCILHRRPVLQSNHPLLLLPINNINKFQSGAKRSLERRYLSLRGQLPLPKELFCRARKGEQRAIRF